MTIVASRVPVASDVFWANCFVESWVHLGAHGDERDQLSSLGIAKNTNECVRARAVHGN